MVLGICHDKWGMVDRICKPDGWIVFFGTLLPDIFSSLFFRCGLSRSACGVSGRSTYWFLAADIAYGIAIIRIAHNASKGDVES